jgi:uncharacterized protein YndB with AHSA1/START domain
MELKTKVTAVPDRQEIFITRDFDLPVGLLFKAYEEAELVGQWMGTMVEKLDSRAHGSYRFVTTDPRGNKHGFNGTIHEFEPGKRITRTFEMENASFGVQLEFLEFEKLTDETSRLTMHVVYRSVAIRDEILKLPFVQGINMAHNRIQELLTSK